MIRLLYFTSSHISLLYIQSSLSASPSRLTATVSFDIYIVIYSFTYIHPVYILLVSTHLNMNYQIDWRLLYPNQEVIKVEVVICILTYNYQLSGGRN
jgi:hypothetical protein